MNRLPSKRTCYVPALAFLSLAGVASSAASQGAPQGRIGVEVVVTDAGVAEGAVATRAPQGRRPYTIRMSRHAASPALLAASAIDVMLLMDRDGDAKRDGKMFRVGMPASAPAREVKAAARLLDGILASAPVDVAGVGPARVGIMYLPSEATRRRARELGRVRIAGDTSANHD